VPEVVPVKASIDGAAASAIRDFSPLRDSTLSPEAVPLRPLAFCSSFAAAAAATAVQDSAAAVGPTGLAPLGARPSRLGRGGKASSEAAATISATGRAGHQEQGSIDDVQSP